MVNFLKSKSIIPTETLTGEQPKKKCRPKFCIRRKKISECSDQQEINEVPKTEIPLKFPKPMKAPKAVQIKEILKISKELPDSSLNFSSENCKKPDKINVEKVHKEIEKPKNRADKREWFRFNKMFGSVKDVSKNIDFVTGLGELLKHLFTLLGHDV